MGDESVDIGRREAPEANDFRRPSTDKLTDELHETVRIGAGMGDDNSLQQDAMARGLETLSVFARFCKASGLAGGDVHAPAGPGLGAGIDWDLINSAVTAVAS